MAVTSTATKSTLAVRIRNGQSSTGEWRYTTITIPSIKASFGTSDDLAKAGGIYGLLTPMLVGTADGMRFVKTNVLEVE